MRLQGKVVPISELCEQDTQIMFGLMDEFYDHMRPELFMQDLQNKDFCVLLYDEQDQIKGFSTQKMLRVPVDGRTVHGVFSGDTIIHKSCWGSLELFKVSIQFLVEYGKQYEEFYWFLISKGYKTYKILTTFFGEFYPTCEAQTPLGAKRIMNAYGTLLYPEEYDSTNGVIRYKAIKDSLKAGVADITDTTRRDKHVAFFAHANPGYVKGEDLACLTQLSESNLTPFARKRLLGK